MLDEKRSGYGVAAIHSRDECGELASAEAAGGHVSERHADLLFDHHPILAPFGQELGVRAGLADAAMLDDDDQVGVGNGIRIPTISCAFECNSSHRRTR